MPMMNLLVEQSHYMEHQCVELLASATVNKLIQNLQSNDEETRVSSFQILQRFVWVVQSGVFSIVLGTMIGKLLYQRHFLYYFWYNFCIIFGTFFYYF